MHLTLPYGERSKALEPGTGCSPRLCIDLLLGHWQLDRGNLETHSALMGGRLPAPPPLWAAPLWRPSRLTSPHPGAGVAASPNHDRGMQSPTPPGAAGLPDGHPRHGRHGASM